MLHRRRKAKFLKKYREVAEREIKEEVNVEGLLQGPRKPLDRPLNPSDLTFIYRPFFGVNEAEHRLIPYFRAYLLASNSVGTRESINTLTYNSGLSLGLYLVERGVVKDLLNLAGLWEVNRLGLMEVVRGGREGFTIRVYEGLLCSGLPNLKRTVCGFVAGVIAGVLKGLHNAVFTCREVRCWGTGYSFCEFNARLLAPVKYQQNLEKPVGKTVNLSSTRGV